MKIGNLIINDKSNTFIIAEIGINHNGRLSLAKKLILNSKKAGADAVKFQKRDVSDLVNFNTSPGYSKGYLSKNEKDIKKNKVKKIQKSSLIGEILAKRAKEKNINSVYFDRGEYKYHGRIKLFAETLRKNGLKF